MERMIGRRGVRFVVGPDGYPLTLEDLPATPPRRWMIRRKAQVVAAVAGGLLTIEQACDRFLLTREEFLTWKASAARYGMSELRTTSSPDAPATVLKLVTGRRSPLPIGGLVKPANA